MDSSKFRMVPKDTMAKWERVQGEAQGKASIQDLGLGGGAAAQSTLRPRPGAGSSGKARDTQAKVPLLVWEEGQWWAESPQARPRHPGMPTRPTRDAVLTVTGTLSRGRHKKACFGVLGWGRSPEPWGGQLRQRISQGSPLCV